MERNNSITPLSVFCAVNQIFHHMSRIFRDNSLPRSQPGGIQIDRKRWAEMQDKRIAMGHKENDHPDYGPTMLNSDFFLKIVIAFLSDLWYLCLLTMAAQKLCR